MALQGAFYASQTASAAYSIYSQYQQLQNCLQNVDSTDISEPNKKKIEFLVDQVHLLTVLRDGCTSAIGLQPSPELPPEQQRLLRDKDRPSEQTAIIILYAFGRFESQLPQQGTAVTHQQIEQAWQRYRELIHLLDGGMQHLPQLAHTAEFLVRIYYAHYPDIGNYRVYLFFGDDSAYLSTNKLTKGYGTEVKIHPVEGETSSSCKIKYGDKVRITADGNKALYRPGIFNWNFRPVFGTFKAPKTYDSKTEWILKNPHKDDDRSTIRAGDCMHITSAAQEKVYAQKMAIGLDKKGNTPDPMCTFTVLLAEQNQSPELACLEPSTPAHDAEPRDD